MTEDHNHWLPEKGKILIEIEVVKFLEATEHRLMRSLMKQEELFPGIVVTKLYRQNFDADALTQSAKENLITVIKRELENIKLEEIILK